jgi:hypothetical protein
VLYCSQTAATANPPRIRHKPKAFYPQSAGPDASGNCPPTTDDADKMVALHPKGSKATAREAFGSRVSAILRSLNAHRRSCSSFLDVQHACLHTHEASLHAPRSTVLPFSQTLPLLCSGPLQCQCMQGIAKGLLRSWMPFLDLQPLPGSFQPPSSSSHAFNLLS